MIPVVVVVSFRPKFATSASQRRRADEDSHLCDVSLCQVCRVRAKLHGTHHWAFEINARCFTVAMLWHPLYICLALMERLCFESLSYEMCNQYTIIPLVLCKFCQLKFNMMYSYNYNVWPKVWEQSMFVVFFFVRTLSCNSVSQLTWNILLLECRLGTVLIFGVCWAPHKEVAQQSREWR